MSGTKGFLPLCEVSTAMFSEWLSTQLIGDNTLEDFLWFAGIILAGFLFNRLLSRVLTGFVFRMLKKYAAGLGFERLFRLLEKPFGILILLMAFYFAFDRLEFPVDWKLTSAEQFGLRMVIMKGFEIAILISVTWIVLRTVDFFGIILLHRASAARSENTQLIPFIRESIKVLIVILCFFVILGAVFGLDIVSIIAGLGIGGLAIALAARESLENLFGSFTIFLDKPFQVGDMVEVGDVSGTIERIGFRSTRIRTFEKTFVTVPNKKMVEGELNNLTLRTQRRVKFFIPLALGTPAGKLQTIVTEIRTSLAAHPDVDKEDCNVVIFELTSYSISIMVHYFISQVEWNDYLKVREQINLSIISIIEKNQAVFSASFEKIFSGK
jgi:MscS family membrane protein